MTRLLGYFFKGLIFLIPIVLSIWVFWIAFRKIDKWLHAPFPGAGVIIVVVVTTGLGFLLSNFITRAILGAFERLLDRLPFVRMLHGSVKDLMGAFVGDKKKFDRPVAVELVEGSGVRALGFLTRDKVDHPELGEAVAVYLPQAYNFAGQLLVVPRARVTFLDAETKDVMAFIVSGGITGK